MKVITETNERSGSPRTRKDEKLLSVIIPTLNEEKSITPTISHIPYVALRRMGYRTEVIVVDGLSTDRTRDLAEQCSARVVIEKQRGYGLPIRTGIQQATGDLIAKIDGDDTYPTEALPALIGLLNSSGLDFLTTDRFALLAPGVMSPRNRFGNTCLSVLVRILFGLKLRDTQSGMWMIRSAALNQLRLQSNLSFSQELKIEAAHFAKLRWSEVSIKYRRRVGSAKFGNARVGLRLITALFWLRISRRGNPFEPGRRRTGLIRGRWPRIRS